MNIKESSFDYFKKFISTGKINDYLNYQKKKKEEQYVSNNKENGDHIII